MVFLHFGLATLAASILTQGVIAHPGHDAVKEAAIAKEYLDQLEQRDLSHCSEKLWTSGVMGRAIERRREIVDNLRRDAGLDHEPMLEKRDIKEVLGTNHRSNQPFTPDTPDDVVFGSNRSCNLAPEIIEGPYYVKGEYVRDNVVDNEVGVPLTLDLLMINRNTCEPIANEMLEIWSCNSTGVYGGVVAQQNGNINDQSNINNTALRGVQPTNSNGVATFKTIVPGHYIGRANHIHVLSHIGATMQPNKTITGGTLSHCGQIYLDQSLLDAVEALEPYRRNTQAKTSNAQDMFMAQGANKDDPVINYVLLGQTVSDGLFGWITLGMDPNAHRTITPATIFGSDGGKKYSGRPIGSRSEGDE